MWPKITQQIEVLKKQLFPKHQSDFLTSAEHCLSFCRLYKLLLPTHRHTQCAAEEEFGGALHNSSLHSRLHVIDDASGAKFWPIYRKAIVLSTLNGSVYLVGMPKVQIAQLSKTR